MYNTAINIMILVEIYLNTVIMYKKNETKKEVSKNLLIKY